MKHVRNILLAIWAIGCLSGMVRNISNYTALDCIIAILVAACPFLVIWIRTMQRKKGLIAPKEKHPILKSILYFFAILWVLGAFAAISEIIFSDAPDKLPNCVLTFSMAILPFEIYAIIKSANGMAKKAIYFILALAFFFYICTLVFGTAKNKLSHYAIAFAIMTVSAAYAYYKNRGQKPLPAMKNPAAKTADLSILETDGKIHKEER